MLEGRKKDTEGETDKASMDLDVLPSESSLSASMRVFRTLRSNILTLKLAPGTILNRNELAAMFEVSQSPLREAILKLEEVGLVVSYPQSRTEVTYINPVRLKLENFLRTAMECEVVNALCEQEKPDLGKARGLLKMQEALVGDTSQIDLFRELDDRFHGALFAAAGQELLHSEIVERSGHMVRLRMLDLSRNRKLESVIEGHNEVLSMIEAGDRYGAADAMRRHLIGSITRLPEIMKTFPQYFR